jgi:hypothetical protein
MDRIPHVYNAQSDSFYLMGYAYQLIVRCSTVVSAVIARTVTLLQLMVIANHYVHAPTPIATVSNVAQVTH